MFDQRFGYHGLAMFTYKISHHSYTAFLVWWYLEFGSRNIVSWCFWLSLIIASLHIDLLLAPNTHAVIVIYLALWNPSELVPTWLFNNFCFHFILFQPILYQTLHGKIMKFLSLAIFMISMEFYLVNLATVHLDNKVNWLQ